MTVAELIEVVDDHGFDDLKLTRKVQVINGALRDVASREAWSVLTTFASLAMVNGVPTSPPTDVQAVLAAHNELGTRLTFTRLDDLYDMAGTFTQTGPARYYYIDTGGAIKTWPTGSTTLQLHYTRMPALVTEASAESAIWLPPEFHETVVIPGALAPLYRQTDDPGFAGVFQNLFEHGIQNARVRLHVQQYSDTDFIHPTSEDWYLDDDVAW